MQLTLLLKLRIHSRKLFTVVFRHIQVGKRCKSSDRFVLLALRKPKRRTGSGLEQPCMRQPQSCRLRQRNHVHDSTKPPSTGWLDLHLEVSQGCIGAAVLRQATYPQIGAEGVREVCNRQLQTEFRQACRGASDIPGSVKVH